jgi:hypothetical protein
MNGKGKAEKKLARSDAVGAWACAIGIAASVVLVVVVAVTG